MSLKDRKRSVDVLQSGIQSVCIHGLGHIVKYFPRA